MYRCIELKIHFFNDRITDENSESILDWAQFEHKLELNFSNLISYQFNKPYFTSVHFCQEPRHILSFWNHERMAKITDDFIDLHAGAFLIVGVLAFPAGWDDPSVQEICGPASRDFYPGQCGLRWAYILAMIGVADILVLSALAFTLAVRHVKLLSLQPYPVAAIYKGTVIALRISQESLKNPCHLNVFEQVKAIMDTSATNGAVRWRPDPIKWWWSPAEDQHQDRA